MILVLLAAATAFAYGGPGVVQGVADVASWFELTEPAAMLVSGSVLIAVAGAVRRLSV